LTETPDEETQGASELGDSVPAQAPDPAPQQDPVPARKRRVRRTKKSKLLDEAKKSLDLWSFLKGLAPADEVRFTVRGARIGTTSGDGEAIGLAMQRYTRFLRVLDADPLVDSLVFGNSATITFRANPDEIARAQAELVAVLAQVLELIGVEPVSDEAPVPVTAEDLTARLAELSDDQRDELETSVQRAVTDVQAAAAAIAQLIAAPASAAPEEAVAYGTSVAEAYKSFATAVARSKVEVEVDDPGEASVSLDVEKAERVVEELRAASEATTEMVTVFGLLSQADAEVHGFGLRLAASARRPEELKGKRMVRGTYRPDVGTAIRDNGLWGTEVLADILVERDALISTSTIRPPKYTLVGVRARYS
jgi:hypothetical protein